MQKTTRNFAAGCLATALLAGVIGPVLAADGLVVATVASVLVSADARWGGCMAKLSVSPATVLPLCGAHWVTFSCTGDYTDPVRAYRMLDQAQLALATNRRVVVQFSDAKRHSGYCFAWRIDVFND